MFWLMGRPQKKEQKRLQELMATLAVGDTIKTTSGFYGVVIDITDDMVIVEFGNNKNCRIPMDKAAITDVEKPEQEA
jgi:preprotein translocase subunit YajC